MKEEAPTKKLPPKISLGAAGAIVVTTTGGGAGSNGGTPVKNFCNNSNGRADEILSTLLRLNNFDSISSIKDESLDIDLSACVTISADPTTGMINGNSLSSQDFWRVLDESAQNPAQLDVSVGSSSDGDSIGVTANISMELQRSDGGGHFRSKHLIIPGGNNVLLKQEYQQPGASSFSGTFLRPGPPNSLSMSPLKKVTVSMNTKQTLPAEQIQQHQRKSKIKCGNVNITSASTIALDQRKKIKTSTLLPVVKLEPPEQLLADDDSNTCSSSSNNNIISNSNSNNNNNNNNNLPTISKNCFNLFLSSVVDSNNSKSSNKILSYTPITSTSNTNFRIVSPAVAVKAHAAKSKSPLLSKVIEICTPIGATAAPEEQNSAAPSLPPPEPVIKCEDCGGMVLRGLQELSVHEAAAHKIIYSCSECQRDFENEASLKKHVKTHRTVESRKDAWKKCPDCGKCLKLGSMWMHRKIHSDNKKYGCDICGQKFVQKINLTHHSRVHTSEKPYECPECQKRFQERSHLQRHQKYHAQTRSYRCEKCGKMYKTERCLKVHNLVHLEQRPFACNVCDKSFISNSKLKQHSNIHTGERPFKCNYCPRDFTNFPNWLKHTRRRHKVDHKTGEHLENIPSYCSKKSTKATAAKAAAIASDKLHGVNIGSAAVTNPVNADPPISTVPVVVDDKPKEATPVTVKPQAKRKKKIPMLPPSDIQLGVITNDATTLKSDLPPIQIIQQHVVLSTANTPTVTKVTKAKRERKQSTPKQVQKTATITPFIKKEIVDTTLEHQAEIEIMPIEHNNKNTTTTNFPDLHCLSITSAEELIMEQALEMEECGLYDAPASAVVLDTDNAVSESAAALHFKIKNEYIDIKEEFISLSEANNRVICSSLESSPYSSPASIEFSSTNAVPLVTNVATAVTTSTTVTDLSKTTSIASFYMPSFRLNTNGSIIATNFNAPNTNTTDTNMANGITTTLLQSIQQQFPNNQQQQQEQSSINAQLPSAQALLNHIYVPITMSMPLLMQPQLRTTQQMLPSVDTLLFTHANSNFFHGKSATAQATAHHNL